MGRAGENELGAEVAMLVRAKILALLLIGGAFRLPVEPSVDIPAVVVVLGGVAVVVVPMGDSLSASEVRVVDGLDSVGRLDEVAGSLGSVEGEPTRAKPSLAAWMALEASRITSLACWCCGEFIEGSEGLWLGRRDGARRLVESI